MKKIITGIAIASMCTLTGSMSNMLNSNIEHIVIQAPNKVEVTTLVIQGEKRVEGISKSMSIPLEEVSIPKIMAEEKIEIVPEERVVYFTVEDTSIGYEFEGIATTLNLPVGTHLKSIQHENGQHLVNHKGILGWVSEESLGYGRVWMVDGTIISNKGYDMSDSFNPGINPEALAGFQEMKTDAKSAGITLNDFSTFRGYQRQQTLYRKYVNTYGQAKADTFSARPGHSEHQTGLAFDIGGANSNLWTSTKLGETKEGKWMADNAHLYGFILRYPKGKEHITGYQYEPWHFRYVGSPLAENIYESGLTLDEYFDVVLPDYKK